MDSSVAPAAIAPRRSLTRTETILAIVRQQLIARATLIDAATDLAELQISVRLDAGTNIVRSVQVLEERFYRRRA